MLRTKYLDEINKNFEVTPICAILGPRQVGKTTLAKHYIEKFGNTKSIFFDLENLIDLAKLDNPMLAFSDITDSLIVIDEIQRRPELFPVLRVLADEHEKKRKFLILGSASRDLLRQSSESLAGRITYMELTSFLLDEVDNTNTLWTRGGFPRAYLAHTDEISYKWRLSYIRTFLEQDIPNLGFNIPTEQLRRFWLMIAHYHGQTFNASELSRSLNMSDKTVKRYLDILNGTFMIRSLTPWIENLKKRQVKSPKIYFRDSGILHALLGVHNYNQLLNLPKLGSMWEGFALEQIIGTIQATQEECYFWSTQQDAELDLFILKNGKRLGVEFKYVDAPKTTKSMNIALEDLKLDHLAVVYPGDQIFQISDKIFVYGLETISSGKFLQNLSKNIQF